MPVIQVFPIRAIQNWINADTFQWDADLEGGAYFLGNFAYPRTAPDAEMTGFCQEQRAAVTKVDLLQQPVKGNPARVAGGIFPAQPVIRMFPFVGVIEVQAHDVEIFILP